MNTKILSESIDIFHENRQSDDLEITEILISKGVEEEIAWKIVCFMPIAFNRVMLASKEINFSSTYVNTTNKEVQVRKNFAEEEIFNHSILLAKSKVGSMSGDKWISVAGRSAEFRVINELLESGSQIKNIRLTDIIINETSKL